MAHCDIIFVLNDKTELKSTEQIDNHLHLFPKDIYEKIKLVVEKARISTTIDWHISVVYVYQDGSTKSEYNVKPKVIGSDF